MDDPRRRGAAILADELIHDEGRNFPADRVLPAREELRVEPIARCAGHSKTARPPHPER